MYVKKQEKYIVSLAIWNFLNYMDEEHDYNLITAGIRLYLEAVARNNKLIIKKWSMRNNDEKIPCDRKNGNSEKHNLVVERTTTHNALSQNYSSDIVITVVYF